MAKIKSFLASSGAFVLLLLAHAPRHEHRRTGEPRERQLALYTAPVRWRGIEEVIFSKRRVFQSGQRYTPV